jgi:DNA-directed RNA polymerase specialized sigma subunit
MQALVAEIEYSRKSVQNILEHFFYFSHAAENGNMDAAVLITDMKEATKKAELTDQQKRVYYTRFLREYTVKEVAEVMGISHQAVSYHVEAIVTKVLRVLNGEDAKGGIQ